MRLDGRRRLGELDHEVGQLAHRDLVGVADVDGTGLVAVEQGQQARDLVVDVAEAPGLLTVAVDRQGFAGERLMDEVGDDPTVVGLHSGAVRVEDPSDPGVEHRPG